MADTPVDAQARMSSAGSGMLTVLLCWSPAPREVREVALRVPAGSSVASALADAQAQAACPVLAADAAVADVGIWGRRAQPSDVLREGDRIELYRPLTVDPKYARRERFRRQGARSAGLFATRRAGGKPGY